MIGFLGAMICRALYTINSDAFIIREMHNDMATFLYFSFITITTIGYGDILPNSIFAKFTAMYLGIIGQLYLAIVMAIIIGKLLNSYRLDAIKRVEKDNDDEETSTNQD
jgi:voltage-gated potassium channel